MSYNAYQQAQQRTETPTEVEYRLFTQVTRALSAVEDRKSSDPELIKALDWNRRMWSTLSTDCSVKGNSLPNELRASIISLSMWVSRHSSSVIRGEESVADLIQINKTIMEGLSLQMKQSRSSASQQQSPADATNPQEHNNSSQTGQIGAQSTIMQNFKPTNI